MEALSRSINVPCKRGAYGRRQGSAQERHQAKRENLLEALWITGKAGTSAVAREVWFAQATRLALSFGHLQSGSSIQRIHGEVNGVAGARRAA